MSTAKDIADAISTRLATITVANGYATDIGTAVYRGRRTLDEQMLPCLVLVEGPDQVNEQLRTQAKLAQRYSIEGHSVCDADNPNDTGHDIIADLKKALFNGDRTFGGPVRNIEYRGRNIVTREDGFNVVAASVDIDMTYSENLAAP